MPFENRRQLVVEPWLERVLDFSVQLEMTADGLKLCGYTGLLNDAKGQFQGNWAESHHHKRIPASVIALFREPPDISATAAAALRRNFCAAGSGTARGEFRRASRH